MRRAPTDRIALQVQRPVWEPLLRHPSRIPAGLPVAGSLRPPDFQVLGHALLTAGTLAAVLARQELAHVTMPDVLRVACMSERTLRRVLVDEGTSWRNFARRGP
jgi:hypothetical protein